MKMPAAVAAVATVFCYALLLVAPTKAVAFFVVSGYIGFLYAVYSDPVAALLTGYVGLIPIIIGKFYPVDLVTAEKLHFLLGRPFGISSDFTVGVPEGIALVLSILLIRRRLRKKESMDRLSWVLFSLPFVFVAISLAGSMRPDLSVLQALYTAEPFIFYIAVRRMGEGIRYDALAAAAAGAVISESLILFAQTLKGGFLGVIVEPYPGYLPFDVSTDAGSLLRMGGTFGYANTLAMYFLFSVPFLLPFISDTRVLMRRVTSLAVAVGFLALLITGSRSAWLAFAAAATVYGILVRAYRIRLYSDVVRIGFFVLAVTAMLSVTTVIPRVISTSRTLERYGSLETRLRLLPEAWAVIRSRPLFGVGLGMDTYALYRKAQAEHTLPVSYFPEPVHNAYMQILMQTGIIGFGAYLCVLVIIGRMLLRLGKSGNDKNRLITAGLSAAFIGLLVNGLMQPLVPDIRPLVIAIAVLSGPSASGERRKKTHAVRMRGSHF